MLSFSLLTAASSKVVGSDHPLEDGRNTSREIKRGSNPILQLGFEAWDGKEDEDFKSQSAEPLFHEADDWQILPAGLMYKSYLAGEKEPRFSATWLSEKRRGLVWETQLGGRVGLIRYGTDDAINPEGWQFDVEGGAQTRVDPNQNSDLEAADFRFGFLSTWRNGSDAFKTGYHHLSSHLGDEFVIRNPTFPRLNYVRDSVIVGWTHDLNLDMQVYAESSYALGHEGGAQPWELQYGFQYSPMHPVWLRGAPYFGINGHTREDRGWITGINTVAGWQWRGTQNNHLFRVGVQYYTGPAIQYSFVGLNETLLGGGIWFDY